MLILTFLTDVENMNVHTVNIIKLNVINHINEPDCNFWNWYYITIFFQFRSDEDFIESVCLNIRCIMLLINRKFLQKHLFKCFIQKIKNKITVWDIDSWIHKCQKYIWLDLYLFDTLNSKMMMIHIVRNVHLIDNLQTNLLIKMNIIDSEHININIFIQKIIIEGCCNMLVKLNIMSQ